MDILSHHIAPRPTSCHVFEPTEPLYLTSNSSMLFDSTQEGWHTTSITHDLHQGLPNTVSGDVPATISAWLACLIGLAAATMLVLVLYLIGFAIRYTHRLYLRTRLVILAWLDSHIAAAVQQTLTGELDQIRSELDRSKVSAHDVNNELAKLKIHCSDLRTTTSKVSDGIFHLQESVHGQQAELDGRLEDIKLRFIENVDHISNRIMNSANHTKADNAELRGHIDTLVLQQASDKIVVREWIDDVMGATHASGVEIQASFDNFLQHQAELDKRVAHMATDLERTSKEQMETSGTAAKAMRVVAEVESKVGLLLTATYKCESNASQAVADGKHILSAVTTHAAKFDTATMQLKAKIASVDAELQTKQSSSHEEFRASLNGVKTKLAAETSQLWGSIREAMKMDDTITHDTARLSADVVQLKDSVEGAGYSTRQLKENDSDMQKQLTRHAFTLSTHAASIRNVERAAHQTQTTGHQTATQLQELQREIGQLGDKLRQHQLDHHRHTRASGGGDGEGYDFTQLGRDYRVQR